jgi:DNA-binding IclR family transcriptional regulator
MTQAGSALAAVAVASTSERMKAVRISQLLPDLHDAANGIAALIQS